MGLLFRPHRQNTATGAIDRIGTDGVRGWCSTSDRVVITVNGQPRITALCWVKRPDAQRAAGATTDRLGYHIKLPIQPGDQVAIHTPEGQLLPGSPGFVGDKEWLDLHWLSLPVFTPLGTLAEQFEATHFCPFFHRNRRKRQLIGAAFDTPSGQIIWAKVAFARGEKAAIADYHANIITPYGLPAPQLLTQAPNGTPLPEQVIFFEYAQGHNYKSPLRLSVEERQKVLATLTTLHGIAPLSGRRSFLFRLTVKQNLYRLITHFVNDTLRSCSPRRIRLMTSMLWQLARLPRVLSHGDMHSSNVILDHQAETITVIDWDHLGMRPTGYDEAFFLSGLSFREALEHLPNERDMRLGFTIVLFCRKLMYTRHFITTPEYDEMIAYFHQLRKQKATVPTSDS